MSTKSIAFIANAKHIKKIQSIEDEIEKYLKENKGVAICLFKSDQTNSIREIARDKATEFDVLVAIGGDGTLHEVINGIFDAEKSGDCIFSFIAAGSANDFQKTMKGETSLKSIFQKLASSSFKKVNVGGILFTNNEGNQEKRYFLNIASLGMGYEVMKEVNKKATKMSADLSYSSAIIKTFISYQNKLISCHTRRWSWQGKIKLMAMANGKYFGSGLCIAPEANPYKSCLEVTIVGDVSLWTYLKKLLPLKRGKTIKHPQVIYKSCSEIEVKSKEVCGIEADGEVIGVTPAKFFSVPEAINIIH